MNRAKITNSKMMKSRAIPLIMATVLVACNETNPANDGTGYTPSEITLESDLMTPEVLWSFGRIGDVAISPDGESALYDITYFDKEEDCSYSDLYILPTDGSERAKRLTNSKPSKSDGAWTPDGKYITYLADDQLWIIKPDGTGAKQLTKIEGGIGGYKISPDGKRLLYIKEVKLENDIHDLHPDLPKANGMLIENQVFRHWNRWITTYSHIFVAPFDINGITDEGKDIMEGEHWESPVRPSGGMEQIAWSPDSKGIIYTCRKKEGVEYFETTNTDLYLYDIESGEVEDLTEGMLGYDVNPQFSPDGTMLAWQSMERDGYESDKNRLMVMDMASREKRDYTADIDQDADFVAWASDSKSLWFVSDYHATDQIYNVEIGSGRIEKLTEGVHTYLEIFPIASDQILATRQSMSKPTELYAVNIESGEAKEISFINENLLSQLEMGRVEERWVKCVDGKEEQVWFIYPPHFDPSQKYPTILYCEGGPQSTVNQFWSYRWNMQIMVAGGYIVVAPNRRGLPGFGKEWKEEISGDYSGLNIQDYLSAIDYAKELPFVDEDNLGCVGASYGGYSVYFLAGCHDHRFKAFIAHCGMFNLEMDYYTTEEMWFANWDMGGAPWDRDNPVAVRSYANSPSAFVGNWDTPILVIHGQKDFRIDMSQGLAAFNSARMLRVPAQFLYLPDECHWVTKCQDGILWQRTFRAWLDRWLKSSDN